MLGATLVEGGVRFAVWAPKARTIEVELNEQFHPLQRGPDGVHQGIVASAGPGTRYRYRLDGGDAVPDPRSRFQPEGVHGPSEVIDPSAFTWSDDGWSGISMDRQVIYELHVGAYTAEGTFAALTGELAELKRLGITAIELMPVADFPGRWNWGYDGVALFAPSRVYGRPDDLQNLVNEAHRIGLAVILDVVYNHLGPDGNYLRAFSDDYFTDRHETPWGDAINFDGDHSRFVRDFVIDNARMWIRDYHFDGLRLDATHAIFDDSPTHILAELSESARAATGRQIVLIAEEPLNDVRVFSGTAEGGYGMDGVWADDFHHQLRVHLTTADETYYKDYLGTLDDLAATIDGGFFFQGQPLPSTREPHGTMVTAEPASSFIFCLQNHDQVGNRPFGDRLHDEVSPDLYAVASAILLFVPETPLLFMGQEFAASAPFLYFTDHEPELGKLVTEGRRKDFSGFRAFNEPEEQARIPDPQLESTFRASKLDPRERRTNAAVYRLYQDLLALRTHDPVLAMQDRASMQTAVPAPEVLLIRRRNGDAQRMLVANFGEATNAHLPDVPASGWHRTFSTTDGAYGGSGESVDIADAETGLALTIPARTAVILSR